MKIIMSTLLFLFVVVCLAACSPLEKQCGEQEFRCDEREANVAKCIPHYWVCDGSPDCVDGSDEINCNDDTRTNTCDEHEMKCDDGQCIDSNWVCDGEPDCIDNSDESNCTEGKPGFCNGTNFLCTNGKCIPRLLTCNKMDDCGDNSDEMDSEPLNCPSAVNQECTGTQFKCMVTGVCIHTSFKCDGDRDCGTDINGKLDESDEADCSTSCSPTELACRNGRCVDGDFKCDGEDDCGDMSDEVGCGSGSGLCGEGELQCATTGHCIKESYWCDGFHDCLDGSDEKLCDDTQRSTPTTLPSTEKPNTTVVSRTTIIKETTNKRNHTTTASNSIRIKALQLNLTTAPARCPTGYRIDVVSGKCGDINECHVFGACGQVCINGKGNYYCECDQGYSLDVSDGKTCRVDGVKPTILVGNGYDVRVMTANGQHTALIASTRSVKALSFNSRENLIYFADSSLEIIQQKSLVSSETTTLLRNIGNPQGLAFDWLHRNLYWSDGRRNQILVVDINTRQRKIVVRGNPDVQIKALETYPEKGYLFWITWGKGQIVRSHLDGSNQKIIAGLEHDTIKPNSISLDKPTDRVYWSDFNGIYTVTLNGNGFERIIENIRPHGIAVFESSVYWTDSKVKRVEKANKFTGGERHIYEGSFVLPTDIKISHPVLQTPVSHPCKDDNGGCSHYCFSTPLGDKKCDCPDGMVLAMDRQICNRQTLASKPLVKTPQPVATMTEVRRTPPVATMTEVKITPSVATMNVDKITSPVATMNVDKITSPVATMNVDKITSSVATMNVAKTTSSVATVNVVKTTSSVSTMNVVKTTSSVSTMNVDKTTLDPLALVGEGKSDGHSSTRLIAFVIVLAIVAIVVIGIGLCSLRENRRTRHDLRVKYVSHENVRVKKKSFPKIKFQNHLNKLTIDDEDVWDDDVPLTDFMV